MRLTDQTIASVKARIDITEVIGHFIEVKKHTACCPFHNEKTESFHIHQAKNIFKCFGCGKGGDAIAFVMEYEKKNYVESIEWLASFYNVPVEYDNSYDPVKEQEAKDALDELKAVVKFAYNKYQAQIKREPAAINYLTERGINREKIAEWGLGFAPDDFRFITPALVNTGKLTAAVQAGISVTKDGKNYDFYRNRIIIPIHDKNGELVGLAGRLLPPNPLKGEMHSSPSGAGGAKYFNPVESLLYQKQSIWFGLYQAITAKAFKENDFVYIVEGYFDVIAMHEAGCFNCVAACGTEMSDGQIKMLMRYAKHMVLLLDGDEPGQKKAMKHVDNLLRLGCKVEVVELPNGQDPAEYIAYLEAPETNNYTDDEEDLYDAVRRYREEHPIEN